MRVLSIRILFVCGLLIAQTDRMQTVALRRAQLEARDVAAAMIEAAKQNKEGFTVYEYDEMKRLITRSANCRKDSDENRESIFDKNA